MARLRKIESPEDFSRQIDEFIKFCEASGEIPSDYALSRFLGVSSSMLERFRYEGKDEGERKRETYKGYAAPFKKLTEFREHRLLLQLESSKGSNSGAIFQLKQPKNGGYTDQQIQAATESTITLRIEGVGGSEAFK